MEHITFFFIISVSTVVANSFLAVHIATYGVPKCYKLAALDGVRHLWMSVPLPHTGILNFEKTGDQAHSSYSAFLPTICYGTEPGYEGCFHPSKDFDYGAIPFKRNGTTLCKRPIYSRDNKNTYCTDPVADSQNQTLSGLFSWKKNCNCSVNWDCKWGLDVPYKECGEDDWIHYGNDTCGWGASGHDGCNTSCETQAATQNDTSYLGICTQHCQLLRNASQSPWIDPANKAYLLGHGSSNCSNGCSVKSPYWIFTGNGSACRQYIGNKLIAVGLITLHAVECPTHKPKRHPRDASSYTEDECKEKSYWSPSGGLAGFLSIITLGVFSDIRQHMNIEALACAITKISNATIDALKGLSHELEGLEVYAQQNRLALDFLLLRQGGVCGVVGNDTCLLNVTHFDISKDIDKIQDSVSHFDHGSSLEWSWGHWWKWLSLIGGNLGLILAIILLICFLPALRGLCTK
ncbi:TPA: envelope glycoprotein [Tapajos virus]|uniref:Env polyprotein n=1 Tax=Tapajos virus TaxID=2840185 RepID=A0AAD3AWJ8_9MONO|nr:envelope glycoprotein [Tapajos virus]FAA04060.1 TPA: envelope glycoprotein [Tapajos virus]